MFAPNQGFTVLNNDVGSTESTTVGADLDASVLVLNEDRDEPVDLTFSSQQTEHPYQHYIILYNTQDVSVQEHYVVIAQTDPLVDDVVHVFNPQVES